jgi:Fe-S cluster assembly scaffold protein SufB
MMDTFVIGDQYKWFSNRAVVNGGRPPDGNIDGEGYTECPQCGWHYFVKVIVRGDNKRTTVMFYVWRGILNNSSGFVIYTSDNSEPQTPLMHGVNYICQLSTFTV